MGKVLNKSFFLGKLKDIILRKIKKKIVMKLKDSSKLLTN